MQHRREQLGEPGYCLRFQELEALARERKAMDVPRQLGYAVKS